MIIKLRITTTLFGDRLLTEVEDSFGNLVYGQEAICKLTAVVSDFTDTTPSQEQVEDLITALKESLRIASAYKVKELPCSF